MRRRFPVSTYRATEKQQSYLRILLNNAASLHIWTYLNLDANHLEPTPREYASYAIGALKTLIRDNDKYRKLTRDEQIGYDIFTTLFVRNKKEIKPIEETVAFWNHIGRDAQEGLVEDFNNTNIYHVKRRLSETQ